MPKDNREIEVKVIGVDIDKFVAKLKSLGAKKVGVYDYQRIIYDYPDCSLDTKHAWIRLRTDGKKTTITYKQAKGDDVDRIEEYETIVGSFEDSRKILTSIGLEEKRTQESRRFMFSLDGVEIDIDVWPMIPPYVEVEAKTKKALLDMLKKLGIDRKDAHPYTGRELYAHHGIRLDDYKDLRLEKDKKEMRL